MDNHPFLVDKSTKKLPFDVAMLVCQRVHPNMCWFHLRLIPVGAQKGYSHITLDIPASYSHIFHMWGSIARGIPKSFMLIRFSLINRPFWGTPIDGNPHIFPHLSILCLPCHSAHLHGQQSLFFELFVWLRSSGHQQQVCNLWAPGPSDQGLFTVHDVGESPW